MCSFTLISYHVNKYAMITLYNSRACSFIDVVEIQSNRCSPYFFSSLHKAIYIKTPMKATCKYIDHEQTQNLKFVFLIWNIQQFLRKDLQKGLAGEPSDVFQRRCMVFWHYWPSALRLLGLSCSYLDWRRFWFLTLYPRRYWSPAAHFLYFLGVYFCVFQLSSTSGNVGRKTSVVGVAMTTKMTSGFMG